MRDGRGCSAHTCCNKVEAVTVQPPLPRLTDPLRQTVLYKYTYTYIYTYLSVYTLSTQHIYMYEKKPFFCITKSAMVQVDPSCACCWFQAPRHAPLKLDVDNIYSYTHSVRRALSSDCRSGSANQAVRVRIFRLAGHTFFLFDRQ